MHQTTRLLELIQDRITRVITDHHTELADLGSDFSPLIHEALKFLSNGKRLRARFLVLGYRSIRALDTEVHETDDELRRVIGAACALELFHAAALIHDDIIDDSATRRGRPAVHTMFAQLHRENQFRGDSERFGRSAAILLGDLLQSWADELLQDALDYLTDRDAARAARRHFNQMRSEVAVGQYLDVLEEQHPTFADDQTQLERSTRVLVYKSAKYSVLAPLLIGAAMAGANESQERSLADYGLPVGVAFQLRDDVLGVFGDEKLTGKPAGDDLAEGKRTVLVTLAREKLPPGPKRIFDDLHGTKNLEADQIVMLQRTIRDSGAVSKVERMIANNIGIAREGVGDSALRKDATRELIELAEYIGLRDS